MNLKNPLLAVCLVFTFEGYSWWDEGHSLVCNKAANLMSADTSANLFSILESDDYGEGCVWPDVIKQVERRETRPWHYINSPPGKDLITPEACPEKGCLMRAYEEQLSLLRTGNDVEKKDAVRFIGHFVADIHQPLHTGFGYDRGGNDHLLTLHGKKKSNMHSIWDGQILEFLYKTHGKKDVHKKIDDLAKKYKRNLNYNDDVYPWINESRKIAVSDSVRYLDNRIQNIDEDYLTTHGSIVIDRLALAIARLAILLEVELSG